MARLKENNYKNLDLNEIKNPVIFVIDMVNGFIKEGALHDDVIAKCIVPQRKLIESLSCRTEFVCDNHPPKTREFESYPPHCVIGTQEAEVVDELQDLIQYVIPKNSTNGFMAPEFQTFLQEEMQRYKDIIVVGCCTDLCILQFALSLQGWLNEHNKVDNRIIIPVDCVETYHNDLHDAYCWNAFALENMKMNGITIVNSIL